MRQFGFFIVLVLLLCTLASAKEISVDYPREVESGAEFEFGVQLIDFDSGIYDIKIDILSNGERISRILNDGEWKSTFNYVKDAIEAGESEEFKLKTEGYIGDADIEVKVRNSAGKVESFLGYTIEIVEETSSQNNEKEEDTNEKQNEEENIKTDDEDKVEVDFEKITDSQKTEEKTDKVEPEVIRLNAQDIKSPENNQEQGKPPYAVLGLVGFCLLLSVLFLFRTRRYKTEFD